MSKEEKIGAVILLAFAILWLLFFGYVMFAMPDYATGGFSH